MPELDLLVLGDANPDLVLFGDVEPDFGQAERLVEHDLVLGGTSARPSMDEVLSFMQGDS